MVLFCRCAGSGEFVFAGDLADCLIMVVLDDLVLAGNQFYDYVTMLQPCFDMTCP